MAEFLGPTAIYEFASDIQFPISFLGFPFGSLISRRPIIRVVRI